MATVVKGYLPRLWQPQHQIVRYKSKINITKPRPLHYRRALVEEICVPSFSMKKPRNKVIYDLCRPKDHFGKPKDNPFETILGREVLNWFKHSKLIAFFHQNECVKDNIFESQVLLKNNGMKCLTFGRKVMEKALTGTIYEPALILFQSVTTVAVGEKPDITNLLKVSKKISNYILMAAIVDNRLLSLSEIQYYSKYESLEAARTNLLGVLNAGSQDLLQKINYHPNALVQLLNQHQQIKKDSKET